MNGVAVKLCDEDVAAIVQQVVDRMAKVGPRYLREHDAADYLGVSVGLLRKIRYAGGGDGIPFVKINDAVTYDIDDLNRWMAARKQIMSERRAA